MSIVIQTCSIVLATSKTSLISQPNSLTTGLNLATAITGTVVTAFQAMRTPVFNNGVKKTMQSLWEENQAGSKEDEEVAFSASAKEAAAFKLQAWVRRTMSTKNVAAAAVKLQAFARRVLAKKELEAARLQAHANTNAAVKLQAWARFTTTKTKYTKKLATIIKLQNLTRRMLAKKAVANLAKDRKEEANRVMRARAAEKRAAVKVAPLNDDDDDDDDNGTIASRLRNKRRSTRGK